MKKLFSVVLLLALILAADGFSANSEVYIKFQIRDRAELGKLTGIISIDNVKDLTVYAYANDDQIRAFEELGYAYEILSHPGTLITPKMATTKADIKAWDSYPTYDAYVAMMYQYAADHPNLCAIVDAGSTIDGRSILFARISDNVAVEEDEPEALFSSSMHGDETTGYILSLHLIDSLLTGYGSDSLITRLVDSCEIWINPLANPDGTYAAGNNTVSGATRGNANYIDLNRNFPDPDDGQHPDGHIWQPETVVMMDLAEAHSPAISANFHGGAEVVNYPWDTWARLHVDNDWFVAVSRQYADSVHHYSPSGYLTDLDNGITNGYAWYTITGGRQDYMNYWRGCREVTIEISSTKLLPGTQLPAHWNYNRVSFLNWFENALYGVRGVVTDASTGDPVFATVFIVSHDSNLDSSRVFTDPDVGDYHRMIKAGTYDVEFHAPGYYLKTVKGVSVATQSGTRLDVALTPLPNLPDLAFVSHDLGTVYPRDTVPVFITLVNNGVAEATGVSATLSSADPYISVIQNYSVYPDISPLGGTGTSLDAFQFAVSSSCPVNHSAAFRLDLAADGGYTDSVTFDVVIGQIIEDFESGDFSTIPWQMGGSLGWTIVSANPYQGTYCAKSGAITHSQTSQMSVTLTISSPGVLSFYYRVSSEGNWDFLRFFIDGVEKNRWSGEVAWTRVTYNVAAGPHTFLWRYTKDGSYSVGSDCAWVDKIVFPPTTLAGLVISTETLPGWTAGVYYSQQLEATGGVGSLVWSDKYNDLSGTGLSLSSAGLVSGIPVNPLVPQTITFTAVVADQSAGSDEKVLGFTLNPVLAIATAALPTGNINEAYSYQLLSEGGTGVKIWSDKNGNLGSTGLTLSSSGLLSGTVPEPITIELTAKIQDAVGATAEKPLAITFVRPYVCGDASGDGGISLDDAVTVVNYIFKGGAEPDPIDAADANGDEQVNIADAVYVIAYIFKGGLPPVCP